MADNRERVTVADPGAAGREPPAEGALSPEQFLAADGPLIGRLIHGYIVERKLGQGGMGSVFLLRHALLPRTYLVLKVLVSRQQELRLRFEQEALVAAAVGSHRVVKPIDVGELPEGFPYIIQEYADGRSLEDELRRQPVLPVERALKIAVRIADTMTDAHDEGILHRDLKPSNIMLVREGKRDFGVRLIDWGIARASGEHKRIFTREFAVLGTPDFWSPEAAMGQPVDARTDVFSLGVITYLMLAGQRPYKTAQGSDFTALLAAPPPPPMAHYRPAELDAVPPAVEALVQSMCERDRARRPWMADARARLHDLLTELSGGAEPRTAVSVVRRAPTPTPSQPTRAGGDEQIVEMMEALRGSAREGSGPVGAAPINSARVAPVRRSPPRWIVAGGALALVAVTMAVTVKLLGPREPAPPPPQPAAAPREPSQVSPAPAPAPPPVAVPVPAPPAQAADKAATIAPAPASEVDAAEATPQGGKPGAAPVSRKKPDKDGRFHGLKR